LLDNDLVETILGEQRKTGRTTTEIIESLRDEGYIAISNSDIQDCVMQCEFARPIWK